MKNYRFIDGRIELIKRKRDKLTWRERQVFDLLAQELRVREIAQKLGLSIKTIESYMEKLKNKLDYSTSLQVFKAAFLWDLSRKG
jgi:DNA-binding NarL/FixJ family response regulator